MVSFATSLDEYIVGQQSYLRYEIKFRKLFRNLFTIQNKLQRSNLLVFTKFAING